MQELKTNNSSGDQPWIVSGTSFVSVAAPGAQQFSIQNLGELSEEKELKSASNLIY
jgi:hypothetical protein